MTVPKNAELLVKHVINVEKLDISKSFVDQRKNRNLGPHRIPHRNKKSKTILSVMVFSVLRNMVSTHFHLVTCPIIRKLANGCRNQWTKE